MKNKIIFVARWVRRMFADADPLPQERRYVFDLDNSTANGITCAGGKIFETQTDRKYWIKTTAVSLEHARVCHQQLAASVGMRLIGPTEEIV